MSGPATAKPHLPQGGLAVLVVNYGSHEDVARNLSRTVPVDFDGLVVVVDNWTDGQERAAITRVCDEHGWYLVASATNGGFGGGMNRAAEVAIEAGATELLLLNPDAYLDPDGLRQLHDHVRSHARCLVAPLVLRPDGTRYSAEVDLHLDRGDMLARSRRPAATGEDDVHTWVSGACMAVTVDEWTTVGGFDESYFLYWEDVDLCRRFILSGGEVHVLDEVVAVHDEGSTHRERVSEAKSPTYYYYNVRNRLVYAAKHLDRAGQRRWILSTPSSSYRILLRGGRRQLIRLPSTWWPVIRGAWDGVGILRRARGAATPTIEDRS